MTETKPAGENGRLGGTRPILLSGVYRSGTTFLAAVVNSIPNVAAASSTVKYLRFCLPHHHGLDDDVALGRLLTEIDARISKRWSLSLDIEGVRRILGKHERSHARIYDAVMQVLLLADGGGATRWAEKLAMQWRDIPVFLEMFPDGQVIHIFRDPRDVTASYKKMTYEPWPSFLDAALNCKAAMDEAPRLQERYGQERILLLNAEDLARDLGASMRRICDFLGEPFDSSVSDLSKFGDIRGEDWRNNTSFTDEKNYEAARPRWKDNLSAEELFLVEMICQPEMSRRSYAGSGQDLAGLDGAKLSAILADPWFSARLNNLLAEGRPTAGYRSDPYTTEMRIVFGEAAQGA